MNKNQIVFNLVEQLRRAARGIVKNYLVIGKILTKVKEEELYKAYASHLRTFEDFLVELRIKRSTAYHSMAVYKEFGPLLESNALDIPFRRLIKLLPIAKNNKEEWLEKARLLTERDFEKEINEAKGLKPDEPCDESCPISYFSYCPKHRRWVKLDEKALKEICKKMK